VQDTRHGEWTYVPMPQLTAAQTSVKLYWRLAAVDNAGNVGAYHGGVFKAPRRHQSKPKPKHKRKH
jgi:hypothetical protein